MPPSSGPHLFLPSSSSGACLGWALPVPSPPATLFFPSSSKWGCLGRHYQCHHLPSSISSFPAPTWGVLNWHHQCHHLLSPISSSWYQSGGFGWMSLVPSPPEPHLFFSGSCGTILDTGPGSTSTICCNGLPGRYVTIIIPGRDDVLVLCEVEVTTQSCAPSPGGKDPKTPLWQRAGTHQMATGACQLVTSER